MTATRSVFNKSDRMQLTNMAGSVALLDALAAKLQGACLYQSYLEKYRQELWLWSRRRHYTVGEVDLDKKNQLHTVERNTLKNLGRASYFR